MAIVSLSRRLEKAIRPTVRRKMAANARARRGVSIALACRAFEVSEICVRYSPVLDDENEDIADGLARSTADTRTCGIGLCIAYLCDGQCHRCNHKRIYGELEANLRIKPKKRLQRGKP